MHVLYLVLFFWKEKQRSRCIHYCHTRPEQNRTCRHILIWPYYIYYTKLFPWKPVAFQSYYSHFNALNVNFGFILDIKLNINRFEKIFKNEKWEQNKYISPDTFEIVVVGSKLKYLVLLRIIQQSAGAKFHWNEWARILWHIKDLLRNKHIKIDSNPWNITL